MSIFKHKLFLVIPIAAVVSISALLLLKPEVGSSLSQLDTGKSFQTPLVTLNYSSTKKLSDLSAQLNEPSGLSISSTGDLWIISDDTSAVFKLPVDGDPQKMSSLAITEKEMEAITLAESEGAFFTANESKGRISRFSIKDGSRLDRQKVKKMEGYQLIQKHVESADKKSGFEGLAWHPGKKTLFTVLEGPPGLLVEISADLKTILSSTPLTEEMGFISPRQANNTVDFSGLSYDAVNNWLWVLSDQAASVYIYDLLSQKVIQVIPLRWLNQQGQLKKVKKAEGIVLSSDSKKLYIVSDSKARLYTWQIHQH